MGGGAGRLGEDSGCREGGLSPGWDGPLPGWTLAWLTLSTSPGWAQVLRSDPWQHSLGRIEEPGPGWVPNLPRARGGVASGTRQLVPTHCTTWLQQRIGVFPK